MELYEEVRDAAEHVLSSLDPALPHALTRFVGRFLGWPFSVGPGFARDRDGNQTEAFACVVHTESSGSTTTGAEGFAADNVAAVIDASEELDVETLRAAYRRVAAAKRLVKTPAPDIKGSR